MKLTREHTLIATKDDEFDFNSPRDELRKMFPYADIESEADEIMLWFPTQEETQTAKLKLN